MPQQALYIKIFKLFLIHLKPCPLAMKITYVTLCTNHILSMYILALTLHFCAVLRPYFSPWQMAFID